MVGALGAILSMFWPGLILLAKLDINIPVRKIKNIKKSLVISNAELHRLGQATTKYRKIMHCIKYVLIAFCLVLYLVLVSYKRLPTKVVQQNLVWLKHRQLHRLGQANTKKQKHQTSKIPKLLKLVY